MIQPNGAFAKSKSRQDPSSFTQQIADPKPRFKHPGKEKDKLQFPMVKPKASKCMPSQNNSFHLVVQVHPQPGPQSRSTNGQRKQGSRQSPQEIQMFQTERKSFDKETAATARQAREHKIQPRANSRIASGSISKN
jgi:hypothetical protein